MNISGLMPTTRQLKLWETPLGNHGAVRYVLGDFVETLTCLLLSGNRHKDQTNVDYCPDISAVTDDTTYYCECKSVGRSRQTMVYEGRLVRDRNFVDAGNPLLYVLWHHTVDTKIADTEEELQMLFLAKMQCIYVVPFNVIEAICRSLPCEKLNSQYGRSDKYPGVYGKGYRIPLSALTEWKALEWETADTPADSPTEMCSSCSGTVSTTSIRQRELF